MTENVVARFMVHGASLWKEIPGVVCTDDAASDVHWNPPVPVAPCQVVPLTEMHATEEKP